MKITKHYKVIGRVQGVGYRYFIKTAANELGVTGWVMNMDDGSVEIEAQADEDTLREFEKYIWKGPSFAKVLNVREEIVEYPVEYTDFRVRFF